MKYRKFFLSNWKHFQTDFQSKFKQSCRLTIEEILCDHRVLKSEILALKGSWVSFSPTFYTVRASLVAQMVKNLPTIQETWVWALSCTDPLGKGMATHSSILAWRIPWTEDPGVLQSMRSQRVRHDLESFTLSWHVPRHCHTKWNKSEKDKFHIISLICEI